MAPQGTGMLTSVQAAPDTLRVREMDLLDIGDNTDTISAELSFFCSACLENVLFDLTKNKQSNM